MISFVLPVDKQRGPTSHDTVQRLRNIIRVREIGHAGSLDPFATGLLLCGVGRGTKILPYLTDLPKIYTGVMRLGRITDSGDVTGKTLEERPVGPVDLCEMRRIAAGFVGRQEQIPPMVSAIKHKGTRLYELARKGIEVPRKPRMIEIQRFEIDSMEGDLLTFQVTCSKGTYVRTLAQDFGSNLGPGASVESLCRRAIGPFEKASAIRLTGDSEEMRARCEQAAISLRSALAHFPELKLRAEWVRKIRNGTQPPWRAVQTDRLPEGERVRLVGPENELVAIASLSAVPGPVDRPWNDSWELRLDRVL